MSTFNQGVFTSPGAGGSIPPGQDVFVKVSAADSTTGYLEDKINNGTGCGDLIFAVQNPGGNEVLGVKTNILRANCLFVSKSGNDGTAVRGNFACHYLTVDAATTAALSGDTIIIYPGTYLTANSLGKDGVSYYGYPGVTITGNGVPGISATGNITTGFYGHMIITAIANHPVFENGANTVLHLECEEVISAASGSLGVIVIGDGNFTGRVHKRLLCQDVIDAFDVQGSGVIDIECPLITDDGAGRDSSGKGIVFIHSYSGPSCSITASIIKGNVRGHIIYANQVDSASKITIKANYFQNDWGGTLSDNSSVANIQEFTGDASLSNFNIYGDIYALGKDMRGIVSTKVSTGILNYYGNIYTDSGPAILLASSNFRIYHYGNATQQGINSAPTTPTLILGSTASINYQQGGYYKNVGGTIIGSCTTSPPIFVDMAGGAGGNIKEVIFQNTTIVDLGGFGASIDGLAAEQIKIYAAQANVDLNPAQVTNIIAPTTLIIDVNIIG